MKGVLCVLCGLYALYYGLLEQDNAYIKWAYGASIVGTILMYVLIGNELFNAV